MCSRQWRALLDLNADATVKHVTTPYKLIQSRDLIYDLTSRAAAGGACAKRRRHGADAGPGVPPQQGRQRHHADGAVCGAVIQLISAIRV